MCGWFYDDSPRPQKQAVSLTNVLLWVLDTRKGVMTDSTIIYSLPPKPAISFTRTFHGSSIRGNRCYEKKVKSPCFLVCKGRSNDDVGVASGTVIQEIRPGAGFETGD